MLLSEPSFDAQFISLRPTLYRHARLALTADDADDAVSNCYVAAREALAHCRAASLQGWLIGILNHKIADVQRLRRRESEFSNLENPAALDYLFESPNTTTFGDLREEVLQLLPIAGLTPQQTTAIRLRIDGWKVCAIAAREGVAPNSISARIREGVRRLHACPLNPLSRLDMDMYYAKRGQQRIVKYYPPPNLGAALDRRRLRQLEIEDQRVTGWIRARKAAKAEKAAQAAEAGRRDEK